LTQEEWIETVAHLFWRPSSAGGIKYEGSIEVGGGVKVGTTAATCSSTHGGTIVYTGECMQYCNGTTWVEINCTETRIVNCTGLPANASWNTVTSITQTRNGTTWMPSAEGTYNMTASTTECRFKCNANYTWNSNSKTCVANTRTFTCGAKPTAGTVWNSVSSYTQTWNGSVWTPADSTTTYNATASTTSCRYKCDTNYTWNGSVCTSKP
jgi:hypothetical protein